MPRNGGPLRCAPPTAPRSGPPSPPSRALSTPRLKFRLDKIRGQRQLLARWQLTAGRDPTFQTLATTTENRDRRRCLTLEGEVMAMTATAGFLNESQVLLERLAKK